LSESTERTISPVPFLLTVRYYQATQDSLQYCSARGVFMGKLYKLFLILTVCVQVVGIQSARAQWVQDGVVICNANGDQMGPELVSDGSGGSIVAWLDYRPDNGGIFVQRIDVNGSVVWAASGVAICTASGDQTGQELISDGAGGAIITWEDWRNGDEDIYAQRIAANGSVMWAVDGIPICEATGTQWYPQIVSDGSGGAIIIWSDSRGGSADIYGQRIDANGSVKWTADGVPICAASGNQSGQQIVSDGSGGCIVVWKDDSSGSADIYAQRIDADGSVMWTTDGVAIVTAGGDQWGQVLSTDASGGAIITWFDFRSGASPDIYAQRVDAAGSAKWAANGVAICTATGTQWVPQIVSDGSGGAIITWLDSRSANQDIYAERVDSNGSSMWTIEGVPICTTGENQSGVLLISDGSSGAIITWEDDRGGSTDIYAQRVGEDGAVIWTANGVAICRASAEQWVPALTSDSSGGAFIAWEDNRNDNWDIYAQRVDAAGHVAPQQATLLQNYSTLFSGTGIALTWTLSEIDKDVRFFIERSTASNGPFIELPSSTLTRESLSFSFIDKDWEPNTSYWYRLEYSTGSERRILFESGPVSTPTMSLTLFQNSPNPFNPSTEIRYYLPEKCSVALNIYDVNGALVAQLTEGYQDKGTQTVSWDGRDRKGRQASSAVYFYRLKAGKAEISKKMVLAR
jgi:hypothetical protein